MIGLYVHIPFCRQKCNYCDFLSFPAAQDMQKQYVAALIKEMKLYGRSGNFRLASVYFGGGTPTLLSEKEFTDLFTAIHNNFILLPNIEITVEANPGTLSFEKARLLKELGVNRISLGVQSMHRDELLAMGRVHDLEDVYKAVEKIRSAGIDNYSFDFMGGLPGQTPAKLTSSLKNALQLHPKHISLYGLKVEADTPWEQLYLQNKLILPNEDLTAEIMHTAQQFLEENAYKRYEISNYALEGFESRHNLRYWLNEPYLGVGLGAASYLSSERLCNESRLRAYITILQQEVFPVAQREKINFNMEQSETLFLGLRLIKGIDIAKFNKRFAVDLLQTFAQPIKKHLQHGLLEITSTHLKLTPRGLELANEVMMDFLP